MNQQPLQFYCSEVWGGYAKVETAVSLPGLRGVLYSQPCGSAQGGDVYYLGACMAGALARICLADVAGHGDAVASISEWLHGSLKRHLNAHDAKGVFGELNRQITERGLEAMTTAVGLTVDSRANKLTFCYAGHPHVLCYGAKEGAWRELAPEQQGAGLQNLVWGVEPSTQYAAGKHRLEPGDFLVVYTDGLVEAPGREGERFGDERLRAAVESANDVASAEGVLQTVIAAMHDFACTVPPEHDDVTLMVFERTPASNLPALIDAAVNHLRKSMRGALPEPTEVS